MYLLKFITAECTKNVTSFFLFIPASLHKTASSATKKAPLTYSMKIMTMIKEEIRFIRQIGM